MRKTRSVARAAGKGSGSMSSLSVVAFADVDHIATATKLAFDEVNPVSRGCVVADGVSARPRAAHRKARCCSGIRAYK